MNNFVESSFCYGKSAEFPECFGMSNVNAQIILAGATVKATVSSTAHILAWGMFLAVLALNRRSGARR